MRKCVDWNNGVPQILHAIKAHTDSSTVTSRGIVKGIYMFTGKREPSRDISFYKYKVWQRHEVGR